MKRCPFHITDHALLRYLERVQGIDMGEVRSQIAKAVAVAEEHEGCTGVVSDGFSYKIQNGAITTVIPTHEPDKRAGRK